MAGSDKRSDKLKRLVKVQRHIERMAEQDLAATTRQRAEVGQSMEEVIAAIGSIDPIHRQFAHTYADRFGRLNVKEKQLAGVQQVQEMRVLKERTKGDRLEENCKEARDHEDREASDNAIYELIELTLATQIMKDGYGD